jgi:long-chain acyl-CoA synthetase
MGLRLKDLNYGLIPLGHSYGLGNLTFPLLCMGVPILCGSSALPHAVAADFAKYKPSVFAGVPAIFRGLVQSEVHALPGLRLAISAGAPLAPEIAKAFSERFHIKIHGFYGSSETGGIAYDSTGSETLDGSGTGRPLDGVQVEALKGRRIRITGPAVFTLNNRTRSRSRGSWIAADRVQINANGSLRLLGRLDKTVKLAGRRLGLQEVAALIKKIEGVSDVWVGVSDGPEPVLGAAVATDKTVAAIREALLPVCPLWKTPTRWVTFDSLPLNGRGKVDTLKIRALLFPKKAT